MDDEKKEAIIEFICERYTGQEVMEALSKEYPSSYKTFCNCEGCKKDKRIENYKRGKKNV
jgi:hypothetical protein